MKWLKKWAYLILFIGTGAGYFICVDHWQVYAESMNQLKSWYEELKEGDYFVIPTLSEGSKDLGGNADTGNENETGNESSGEQNPSNNLTDGSEGDLSGNLGNDSSEDLDNNSAADSDNITADNQGNVSEGEQESAPEGSEEDSETGPVEYMTVEDDYFSDALFIGDSRTVGMFEYGGLEEITTFYASKGLTIYRMFDSQIVSAPGGKITVEEGLQQNTFSKIYLMIGINEMGTGTVETFLEKYKESVEHLQELQPEAVIYLQAIIKVTTERSEKGDYINNEGIDARNEGIALLADDKKVFYLDVNPLICDESGGMEPSYTFDGVHLKAKYIEIWKDYLKTHAISP